MSAIGPAPSGGTTRAVHGVLLASAVGFALLTGVVAADPTWLASLDRAIGAPALDLTRAHAWLERLWAADAVLEQPQAFRLVLVLLAAGFALRRRWRTASWLVVALALSAVAAPYVKLVVRRPRPIWPDPIRTLADYSYPSGHATAAWTAVAVTVIVTLTHVEPGWWRRTLLTCAVGAALLVSADRVFLGVHHPSDVVAGALLGTTLACAAWSAAHSQVAGRLVRRGW